MPDGDMVEAEIENKMRRIVRARMPRGHRLAVAEAAGHANGTWVTNWLTGVQKHASIDEIVKMLVKLKVDPAKALAAPGAADDLDWQVFGLMGQLAPEQKQMAYQMIRSVVPKGVRPSEPQSTATATPHPNPARRRVSDKRQA